MENRHAVPARTKVRADGRCASPESLGPQRATIPNVVGQSRRAAEMNIARRALELGTAPRARARLAARPGRRAESPALLRARPRPKVNPLINAPANEQEFVMPDFTGRQLTDVFDAADAVGMKIVSTPVDAVGPAAILRRPPIGPRRHARRLRGDYPRGSRKVSGWRGAGLLRKASRL